MIEVDVSDLHFYHGVTMTTTGTLLQTNHKRLWKRVGESTIRWPKNPYQGDNEAYIWRFSTGRFFTESWPAQNDVYSLFYRLLTKGLAKVNYERRTITPISENGRFMVQKLPNGGGTRFFCTIIKK